MFQYVDMCCARNGDGEVTVHLPDTRSETMWFRWMSIGPNRDRTFPSGIMYAYCTYTLWEK